MFGTLWAAISGYAGGLLRAIAVFVFVLLLGSVAFFALNELAKLVNGDNINPLSLPIVAIGGVTLLILVLTIVATIFGFLGLTNKDQAMGLPEGSIRSVIALSLIVLFAILAVFLYEGVSGGPGNKIENLSEADRAQFLRDHTTTKDIQSVAVTLVDKEGQPLRSADGSVKNVFTVTYRSEPNSTSNDFAKQLLVILGTLMTAITSFYLGAGTATSAVAAGAQTSDTTKPTLSSINPSHHSIATGATIHLEVLGKDLNVITHVKIVRGGVQVIGTNVASNPTKVSCDLAVVPAHIGAPWDVVVDDGGSKSAALPAALTISD
jgi:hypothetical protein